MGNEYTVIKASDWDRNEERVVINSVDDLKALSKQFGGFDLIINFDDNIIRIYDSYIE